MISLDEIQALELPTGKPVYLMPVSPTEPVSSQNVAVVTKRHRQYLLAVWGIVRDSAAYQRVMGMVQHQATS